MKANRIGHADSKPRPIHQQPKKPSGFILLGRRVLARIIPPEAVVGGGGMVGRRDTGSGLVAA
jgi:hypothetical protein